MRRTVEGAFQRIGNIHDNLKRISQDPTAATAAGTALGEIALTVMPPWVVKRIQQSYRDRVLWEVEQETVQGHRPSLTSKVVHFAALTYLDRFRFPGVFRHWGMSDVITFTDAVRMRHDDPTGSLLLLAATAVPDIDGPILEKGLGYLRVAVEDRVAAATNSAIDRTRVPALVNEIREKHPNLSTELSYRLTFHYKDLQEELENPQTSRLKKSAIRLEQLGLRTPELNISYPRWGMESPSVEQLLKITHLSGLLFLGILAQNYIGASGNSWDNFWRPISDAVAASPQNFGEIIPFAQRLISAFGKLDVNHLWQSLEYFKNSIGLGLSSIVVALANPFRNIRQLDTVIFPGLGKALSAVESFTSLFRKQPTPQPPSTPGPSIS